ncbi:hypothetical protein A7U60_g446 [Sanghuangporus baumii]|uniref:Uncharacterized protein n=1 Tax=Sanghuangporus baumii TaxID=108892 RepID=A0A9Q5I5S1_SANBA|nr:hypothetical protein A7U60_g446 [Sanghuangporus baumii]
MIKGNSMPTLVDTMRVYPSCEWERAMFAIYTKLQKDTSSLGPIPRLEEIVAKLSSEPGIFQELILISNQPLLFFAELCCGMPRLPTSPMKSKSTTPLRRSERVAVASRKRVASQAIPGKSSKEGSRVGAEQYGSTHKRKRSEPEDVAQGGGSNETKTEDRSTSHLSKKAWKSSSTRNTKNRPRKHKN